MIVTMGIGLYTSRVILNTLGVEDYGLYQVVGGVVGMMTFVNAALATGSSRFLTYEMGTGNAQKLKLTFSTVFYAHLILALLIVIIGETVGLWFLYSKLVIPAERMSAAVFAYHISILTAVVNITQAPYSAIIISHERMGVYVYMALVDVVLKLLIVYILCIGDFDRLKLYALLMCLVSVGIALFYRQYCIRHFEESHLTKSLDWNILKQVTSYSGWNLFASVSIMLITQGTTILINMFFSPSVVAGRAIANSVNTTTGSFVSNFRTASNPQIVKKFAAGDFEGSRILLLRTTTLSYFLMLIIVLPLTLVAPTLLQIWLGQIPDYSIPFLRLALITSLFQVFDTGFYTALYAKGRIKENAMLSPTCGFIGYGLMLLCFKVGSSPIAIGWILMLMYATLGCVVKPYLLIKIVNYQWRDLMSVYIPCLKVTLLSLPIPIAIYLFRQILIPNEVLQFVALILTSVLSVAVTVWRIGISSSLRKRFSLTNYLTNLFKRN
jgi:O-antigen/teichoic acid export membrane protein